MAVLPGTRFGPYEIVELIGAGGMGEVYKAHDTRLDRTVAIKVLLPSVSADPARRARFAREAQTIASLAHPHICTIHDIGEEAGSMFLVMPHLDGTTLAQLIDHGPLPIDQAVRIGAEIADAVAAAHRHGIIHRDLKPTNVIITSTGDAVVLDFGVAKRVIYPESTGEDPTLDATCSTVVLGTLSYMAPEQVLGKRIDFRSDVFSLGAVLYEMVTGRRAFHGSTPFEIADALVHRTPASIVALNPAVPPAVEGVITRCLEKNPDDRFQAVADVASALRRPVPGAAADRSQSGASRLPHQLTRFIGRRRELSDVRMALDDARLVTLSGPGGIGKTRLALQAATSVIHDYADGVWFVDLAPVSEPELVPQTLASALGIREERGQPLTETLKVHLSPKSLLIILDNCEHLIGACARLADTLLRACPRLRILATSREPLGITGEEILRVPSLSLPEADQSLDLASVADHESIQLFIDRARLVKASFALTSANAVAVMRICARLEGIPLAIELAASRLRVLSVEQVLAKLHDRLGLLTGSRTAVGRHQTLLAAIDWSYNLLTQPERTLFRRLAVFAGGWTLEAAEAICAGGDVGQTEVLELLAGLVDKSLVLAEERHGYPRYGLMMTVLEYAHKGLASTDEQPALQHAHARFFTTLAVEGDGHLMSPGQTAWRERLTTEHDNFRAALKWAWRNDAELALRLGAALGRFWYLQAYWGEGRSWLEALLALEGAERHPGPRVQVLNAAARLIQHQGDHEAGRAMAEEALRLARTCGDESEAAVALNTAAIHYGIEGDFATARALSEESLAIRRRLGNKGVIALTLNNLGVLAAFQAEYERASALLHESLDIFRELDDTHGIGMSLINLGDLLGRMGDEVGGRSLVEEGLALARSVADRALIPIALNTLGELVCQQGDHETARALNQEALDASRQVGDKRLVASALLSLAVETEHREAYAEARRAFETTLALLRELGDKPKIALALNCLGRAAARDGDHAVATACHEEGLELCRHMGMRDGIAASLVGLADVAWAQGDDQAALALCRRSLAILLEIGDHRDLPQALERIALLFVRRNRLGAGTSLYAAAQAIRDRRHVSRPPSERAEYERHLAWSRSELGDAAFTAAWARGLAMTLDQAVACALEDAD